MLDETSLTQRLAAEFIGTAFLVFIGVGSVPATLIVNGNAPFTMADLGMISLAFGTIVVATVYALGHIGGNHINPAVTLGLAVTGKFPWRQVPAYIAAQVARCDRSARPPSSACSARRPATSGSASPPTRDISWTQAFFAEFVGTFILVFTSSASSTARPRPGSPAWRSASSCSRRSSRSRRPLARRSTRPAPSARCSSSSSPAAP